MFHFFNFWFCPGNRVVALLEIYLEPLGVSKNLWPQKSAAACIVSALDAILEQRKFTRSLTVDCESSWLDHFAFGLIVRMYTAIFNAELRFSHSQTKDDASSFCHVWHIFIVSDSVHKNLWRDSLTAVSCYWPHWKRAPQFVIDLGRWHLPSWENITKLVDWNLRSTWSKFLAQSHKYGEPQTVAMVQYNVAVVFLQRFPIRGGLSIAGFNVVHFYMSAAEAFQRFIYLFDCGTLPILYHSDFCDLFCYGTLIETWRSVISNELTEKTPDLLFF